MEKLICKKCGKLIEGYTQRHVETLMAQHMIKHQNEDKIKHQNEDKRNETKSK